MNVDLVSYLTRRTPVEFLRLAVERLESAYFEAHSHADKNCDAPERPRVRGQLRHYYQNQALRTAANDTGLVSVAAHTDPKGERYSLITAQDVRFGRIGVPFKNRTPRPAKHRNVIAALNGRLEPMGYDLFSPSPTMPADGLGVLIVTINPSSNDNQSTPKDIYVGVPYTNVLGWHLFEPVTEIMMAYHQAVDLEVPDLAWVALRKKLRDSE